jgi:hypothetical protein
LHRTHGAADHTLDAVDGEPRFQQLVQGPPRVVLMLV